MSKTLRVVLEAGPSGKGVAAVAIDWPGWERGAKTREDALASLLAYRERYAPIASSAGLARDFLAQRTSQVVEEYVGVGMTDFWRISFASSSLDEETLEPAQLERDLRVLVACWEHFDAVRSQVSAELAKGPRGGGRDRERIVEHVTNAERSWARKLDVRYPGVTTPPAASEVADFRRDYVAAIRRAGASGAMARTWTLRFLIRHSAYHVLDHAWEMQDKDLTGSTGTPDGAP